MQAVDTNVLVRIFTQDDPTQTAAATRLFSEGTIWISRTVLLETSWVLTSGYSFTPAAVAEAFGLLLGASNIRVEDEESVAEAIALVGKGLQFPDALHLTGMPPNARFFTFDKTFVARAKRAGITRISAIE